MHKKKNVTNGLWCPPACWSLVTFFREKKAKMTENNPTLLEKSISILIV